MPTPPRRVAPQSPLYFGSADASTPTAELIAALEASLVLTFTQMTDQIADAQVPQSAVTQYQAALSIAWSQLTATPTTLAGYGITDAYTKTASDARFAPIAVPWVSLTGVPTTVSGYGITDAYTKTASDARFAAIAGPFPWADVTGAPAFLTSTGPFPWANVTGTPTTLTGYGITDAYTKTASDARFAPIAVPWSSLTGVPTTVSGYGITDFNSLGDARWSPLAGSSSLVTVGVLASPHMTGAVVDSGGLVITAGNLETTSGVVGIGSTTTQVALNVQPAVGTLTSNSQYGIQCAPTFSSAATAEGKGLLVVCFTEATAYTLDILFNIRVSNASLGAGSSVTTQYGLKVENLTSAATNYAIFTGTGLVRFGDAVTVTSTITADQQVYIKSATTPNLRIQSTGTGGLDWYLQSRNSSGDFVIREDSALGDTIKIAGGTGVVTIYNGLVVPGQVTITGAKTTVDAALGMQFGSANAGFSVDVPNGKLLIGDYTTGAKGLQITYATGTASFSSSLVVTTSLGVGSSAPSLVTVQISPPANSSPMSPGTASGTFAITSANQLYGLYFGTSGSGYSWIQAARNDGTATAYDLQLQMSGGGVQIGGSFGCNSKSPQTSYASGGALAAYGAGANGFDTAGNASALHALVVAMRAALVANGIMS